MTVVKIFGALLAATLGVVVLPRLARALFPNAALGWDRILALNALLFLYWRDHFDFPLADFPALLTASVGVIALLRRTTWGYAGAGVALGLAASMRGNYWFALVAALLVAALLPLRSWSWRTRGAAVGLVLAGALVASLPQVLVNHRHHDTWSPTHPDRQGAEPRSPPGSACTAQKYETYVGPPSRLSAAQRVVPRSRDDSVCSRRRASRRSLASADHRFPAASGTSSSCVEHPITMSASYARHLFNGLDVKYPTPYVRDLDNTSTRALAAPVHAPVRGAREARWCRAPAVLSVGFAGREWPCSPARCSA